MSRMFNAIKHIFKGKIFYVYNGKLVTVAENEC